MPLLNLLSHKNGLLLTSLRVQRQDQLGIDAQAGPDGRGRQLPRQPVRRSCAQRPTGADSQPVAGPGPSPQAGHRCPGLSRRGRRQPGRADHPPGQVQIAQRAREKLLMRRQAIEPLIGRIKVDLKMNRRWLAGELGDALRSVAGYNIRWPLRAIARMGLGAAFYAQLAALMHGMNLALAMLTTPMSVQSVLSSPQTLRSAAMSTHFAAAG